MATDYEEKISGLIDSAATSGLLGSTSSSFIVTPSGQRQGYGQEGVEAAQGALGWAEEVEEQLRCMLRLSNERNEALKGQMQQVRAAAASNLCDQKETSQPNTTLTPHDSPLSPLSIPTTAPGGQGRAGGPQRGCGGAGAAGAG